MNILKSVSRTFAIAAAAASMTFTPLASADALQTINWANGHQSFGLSIGGTPPTGGFTGIWEGDEIYFWCIELTEYFQLGQTYQEYVPVLPDEETVVLLGQLFTQAWDVALNSPTNSAAFQLAIWEIIYDHDNLSLSQTNGFWVTDPKGNAQTVEIAQGWLDNLSEHPNTQFSFIFLVSDGPRGHQNFVTFGTPVQYSVPEPGLLPLFAAALLIMAFTMRRRRAPGASA